MRDGLDAGPEKPPPLTDDGYPTDELVAELTASLRPRLDAGMSGDLLEEHVRSALNELAPMRVTTYLGVLVERRLRVTVPQQRRAPTASPVQDRTPVEIAASTPVSP